MKPSRPILSAFFNRKHRSGFIYQTVNHFPCIHNGRIAVPIVDAARFASSVANLHPSIEDLRSKLDALAPRFELQRGDVEILTTPGEFYETLKWKILSAKKRVFLSSLYVGKEETELVEALEIVGNLSGIYNPDRISDQ